MLASHRVSFVGSENRLLQGILDRPADPPKAYLVMAHCFTCSKDLKANVRIARGLAQLGWAALRFDFAGLGNSQGDFATTNFRTNQIDLLAAIDYLSAHHQAPSILLGHSFGGAAAISLAMHRPSIRGVVAIASPSDTSHLADVLLRMDPRIESLGQGEVTIGGRPLSIHRQMIEDFRSYDLGSDLAKLNKPLLIFHSPVDETVSYQHALQIFKATQRHDSTNHARTQTSLITLPDTDHLLVRKPEDLPFVISLIDAWAVHCGICKDRSV